MGGILEGGRLSSGFFSSTILDDDGIKGSMGLGAGAGMGVGLVSGKGGLGVVGNGTGGGGAWRTVAGPGIFWLGGGMDTIGALLIMAAPRSISSSLTSI